MSTTPWTFWSGREQRNVQAYRARVVKVGASRLVQVFDETDEIVDDFMLTARDTAVAGLQRRGWTAPDGVSSQERVEGIDRFHIVTPNDRARRRFKIV